MFKKTKLEPTGTQEDFEVTDISELKNMISELANQNKTLTQNVSELANQNKQILEENLKVKQNMRIEEYGTNFGIPKEEISKVLKSTDSLEDKLFVLLDGAKQQISEIKNGLVEKGVGDLPIDNLVNKYEPKDIDSALDLAKQEKPELKGEELVDYAQNKYAKVFNMKEKHENITKKLDNLDKEV